jgi:hypothetical protein
MKTAIKSSPRQLLFMVILSAYEYQMKVFERLGGVRIDFLPDADGKYVSVKFDDLGTEEWEYSKAQGFFLINQERWDITTELTAYNRRYAEKSFKNDNYPGMTLVLYDQGPGVRIEIDELVGPYNPLPGCSIPRLSRQVENKVMRSGLARKYPGLFHLMEMKSTKNKKGKKGKSESDHVESEYLELVD